MLTTSLTSKGQVTIPALFRVALGLNIGDQIDFKQMGDSLVLKRHENKVAACFGLLKASHGVSLAEMDLAIQKGATE
jgi:antitoxin PrlF